MIFFICVAYLAGTHQPPSQVRGGPAAGRVVGGGRGRRGDLPEDERNVRLEAERQQRQLAGRLGGRRRPRRLLGASPGRLPAFRAPQGVGMVAYLG